MSEQCTQGRISMAEWKAGEDAHGFNLVTSEGDLLPLCDMEAGPDDDYEANARRLVACWNACEGITTERLEDLGRPLMKHLIGCDERAARQVKEAAELCAQRDELLAGLKAAGKWIDSAQHGDNCFVSDHYEGDPGNGCNCGKDGFSQYIDDAIAKAEGTGA